MKNSIVTASLLATIVLILACELFLFTHIGSRAAPFNADWWDYAHQGVQ